MSSVSRWNHALFIDQPLRCCFSSCLFPAPKPVGHTGGTVGTSCSPMQHLTRTSSRCGLSVLVLYSYISQESLPTKASDTNANVMFCCQTQLLRERTSVLPHLGGMSVSVMVSKNEVISFKNQRSLSSCSLFQKKLKPN